MKYTLQINISNLITTDALELIKTLSNKSMEKKELT